MNLFSNIFYSCFTSKLVSCHISSTLTLKKYKHKCISNLLCNGLISTLFYLQCITNHPPSSVLEHRLRLRDNQISLQST